MHTCIYISPQLVHARLCNGAAASLPWKLLRTYLESCANIVQAVVSAHPPAPSSSRPPSCWPVTRHVRLRKPIKSTLAHDAVAAVVLHKHHLIIRVGAGLIQFVYGSHSRLAADLTLDKNQFPLPFSRAFYEPWIVIIHVFRLPNRTLPFEFSGETDGIWREFSSISLVEEDSGNQHSSRESSTFVERHRQPDSQLDRITLQL